MSGARSPHRLASVAARHATTPARLRDRLERDPSLWVDETLQLFYVEPARASGAPEAADRAGAVSAAPGDVFALHRQSGADRVIYLDFDGHTTTGTGWNNDPTLGTGSTLVSPPYDRDGDPASFSTAEQDVVYDGGGAWSEDAKLTPVDAEGFQHFGNAVAIDDRTAVIGAWLDGTAAATAGAAHVFEFFP